MEGKWVWSHFNGVIGKVGNYINDKAEGLFHFYNKNGVIYAIDVYKMGKMVGFSKYFNYNGELVEDAFFSNDIFIFSRKYDKNGKSKGLLFKI
jgi:antitoxin component YwqK of YwqJK toxin-antitoxin module